MAVSWISRLSARSIPNRMIKKPYHYTSEADSPLSARQPMNLGVSPIFPQKEWPFQARPKKCRAVSSEPVVPLNCSLADLKKASQLRTLRRTRYSRVIKSSFRSNTARCRLMVPHPEHGRTPKSATFDPATI